MPRIGFPSNTSDFKEVRVPNLFGKLNQYTKSKTMHSKYLSFRWITFELTHNSQLYYVLFWQTQKFLKCAVFFVINLKISTEGENVTLTY